MLAVVLAAGWAGCKKSEPGAAAPAAEPGAAKPLKFAFVTNNSSDFWNIAEKGVRKAEKDLGVQAVVFRPLKTEVAEQQRFIEDILVQNFDGMAICAINPDAMTGLLDKVAARCRSWCTTPMRPSRSARRSSAPTTSRPASWPGRRRSTR